jgi:primosomal protein N' (replication factor Y)
VEKSSKQRWFERKLSGRLRPANFLAGFYSLKEKFNWIRKKGWGGMDNGRGENQRTFAEILINIPSRQLDRPFQYRIPAALHDRVVPGARVLVPFGTKTYEGIVLATGTPPQDYETRDILSVEDVHPLMNRNMLKLALWMADHYLCTRAEALRCVLPTGVRWESTETVEIHSDLATDFDATSLLKAGSMAGKIMAILKTEGRITRGDLEKRFKGKSLSPYLKLLETKGWITREQTGDAGIRVKEITMVSLLPAGEDPEILAVMRKRAPKQAAVVDMLSSYGGQLQEVTIRTYLGITPGVIHRLADKGLVRLDQEEVTREPYPEGKYLPSDDLVLSDDQAQALQSLLDGIDREDGTCYLLHGVTGSGKTEIYLQAIRHVRSQGKQAIVLVPEIALTPQTVERFKSRFGGDVAVLHSRLSVGERYDQWRRIHSGDASVVVGARSALFAPVAELGLVIIDEEHEPTYKQSENPKYHARDVALMRCKIEGATLLLGSATPSMDTYYKAMTGEFTLLNLPDRITGKPLPEVEIVDMREELKAGNRSPFSRILRERIQLSIDEKRQTILFLNRRGYSTFVLCRECGYVLRCPHCDVSLTYHADRRNLQCHYCQFTAKVPDTCPKCHSHHIRYFGIGTERVEEEIQKWFPGAKTLRMDMDTTAKKGSHDRILSAFKSRKADILIGTQMIAKGLDFEHVTLVGVITADTSLNFPDYISGERTFQLMTQVAGRAGRGDHAGVVVVQTYTPDHYSIRLAKTHDYKGFYQEEIEHRRQLEYPPFAKVLSILVWSSVEQDVIQGADALGRILADQDEVKSGDIRVMGPVPALMAKVKNNYRWQMFLLGVSIHPREMLSHCMDEIYKIGERHGIRISIDVDPLGLM